jgi:thioredoxin reductase (NADPH)
MMEDKQVVIIGSGPAGYTAAIYCARARLNPVVFEGFYSGPPGGQLMTTTEVENYPGFAQGISGPKLMQELRDQAKRFETVLLPEDVLEVDLSQQPFVIKSKRTEVKTHAIIIATGATAKRLDVPGTLDGEFWQKGVSACAVCDGAMPIFRDKDLYVIGGGDSAVEEALFLTKYASRVYLVHRRESLRASKIMTERLLKHPKVEVLWHRELAEVLGDSLVRQVVLKNTQTEELETRAANGVFFAIGHTPNTRFLKNQILLESNGYIHLNQGSTMTNVDGVFAAGDVADHIYRQAITAAGSGCMAAMDVEKWLFARGYE